jgi:glutamate-1-semialdehyde aminotransferase
MARAVRVDARAATRGDILADPDGSATVYPRYAARLHGAYVWDVDGHRYIDYQLGYGPVVLGHSNEQVTAAAVRQLAAGNCLAPLWSPLQVELCERLVSLVPGAEMAYLLKTGSDATSAAVRLARIATGRSRVVRWGYNGWHDWAAGKPAGVPPAVRADTLTFDYGDLDSLRTVLDVHQGEVACVLMMPFGDEVAPDGYLQAVRELAHRHGALFVLDEMRSGFRLALGGAQEHLGVRADLSTFSKAMANGFPISAVVGSAEVMRGFGRTRISSTFYAGPVEMAAALETIRILAETPALKRIWQLGTRLQDGLRAIVAETGLRAEVVGYPPIPFLRFVDPDPVRRAADRDRFHRETTRRGLLLHPEHQWFVSAAHTDEDVDLTLAAMHEAAEVVLGHD